MTRITTPFGPASTAAEVAAGIDLTGRRAIVTGAASGIGLATATMLARNGARVAVNFPPDDPRGREAVERLRADGVPTAIYYPRPLHRQPAYAASHDGAALPVSDALLGRILALPIHPDLSDEQAERVCDAVQRAMR